MDRVALDLGFIQIYWYSIFIFLGLLIACTVIYRESKKRGIDEDTLINMTFTTVIAGIIGARLYYVLFNLSYYLQHPIEIFEIWNGGLAIHGAIIAGLITIFLFCKQMRISFMRMLDIIVVGLIIGQAIGRWGNFFNSEAYGAVTTLQALESQGIPKFIIDGMYILGEYRQPTFLYESIWCFLLFIFLMWFSKHKRAFSGQILCLYGILYSIERFFVESFRTDSLMIGPLRQAQVISLVIIAACAILYIYLKKKHSYSNRQSKGEF